MEGWSLRLQQEPLRVLQQLADPPEELDGGRAVDQTVVVGEAEPHHRPDHDLAVPEPMTARSTWRLPLSATGFPRAVVECLARLIDHEEVEFIARLLDNREYVVAVREPLPHLAFA